MQEREFYPPKSGLGLFLKMGGWVPVIFGVILCFVTMFGQLDHNTAKRFQAEGKYATALVEDTFFTESQDSDGDLTITYWVVISFITQAKEEITVTRTVGSQLYRTLAPDQEIEMRYLASDPEVTELEEGSYASGARVARGIALVLGVIWLVALWMTGRWTVEALRARRYGRCEMAEVTAVERSAVRINNRARFRVLWKDGQGRPGKSFLRKAHEVKDLNAGDAIRIYQGLKRPWWAGDIGDRAER